MYQLKEYCILDLPNSDSAVQRALDMASEIEKSWTPSKTYAGIQSYTQWVDNMGGTSEFWAARISYHDDISYQSAYDTLYTNHTENEAEYIGMLESYEILDSQRDWSSRLVRYQFPFPLSKREMAIWLTQKETQPGTQFVNVTIPRKYPTSNTQAKYVSVEVVTKLPDNRLKWVVATTSDAGGLVPQFLQRPRLAQVLTEDVPQFKQWLQNRTQE